MTDTKYRAQLVDKEILCLVENDGTRTQIDLKMVCFFTSRYQTSLLVLDGKLFKLTDSNTMNEITEAYMKLHSSAGLRK